ncbi:unnamed protein product [Bursaphelenchus okinawaensis]|uniref:Uncharacterized protein n=1 Tax=Bursaphelenchus okinawaensis TaxID=465554 RepID=A0A811JUW3_9BILA|nr:unnamed protein product [Bursaphelenchus okinawaensis]CAG9084175.1 unnamed protein product [Bursaphelenchus okinawaensis]
MSESPHSSEFYGPIDPLTIPNAPLQRRRTIVRQKHVAEQPKPKLSMDFRGLTIPNSAPSQIALEFFKRKLTPQPISVDQSTTLWARRRSSQPSIDWNPKISFDLPEGLSIGSGSMARRKHSLWGMSAAQLQFLRDQHEKEREERERSIYEQELLELQLQHQYWLMQHNSTKPPKHQHLLQKRSQPPMNLQKFSAVIHGQYQNPALVQHSQTQMFAGRKITQAGFLNALPMRAATVAGPAAAAAAAVAAATASSAGAFRATPNGGVMPPNKRDSMAAIADLLVATGGGRKPPRYGRKELSELNEFRLQAFTSLFPCSWV